MGGAQLQNDENFEFIVRFNGMENFKFKNYFNLLSANV